MVRREIESGIRELLKERDEVERRDRRMYDEGLGVHALAGRLWCVDADWYGAVEGEEVGEEWRKRCWRLRSGVLHYASWRLGVFYSSDVVKEALGSTGLGEVHFTWVATAPIAEVVEWVSQGYVRLVAGRYVDTELRQGVEESIRDLLRERDEVECRARPLYDEDMNLYELAYRLFGYDYDAEYFDLLHGEARGRVSEGWLERRDTTWETLVEVGRERVGKFYSKPVVDFVMGVPDRIRGAVYACFSPLSKVARRIEGSIFPLLITIMNDVEGDG